MHSSAGSKVLPKFTNMFNNECSVEGFDVLGVCGVGVSSGWVLSVIAVERLGDGFRVGYQEAAAEAVRFLVEVQGCGPGDGLCVQLASHLHRRCENVIKGKLLSSSINP